MNRSDPFLKSRIIVNGSKPSCAKGLYTHPLTKAPRTLSGISTIYDDSASVALDGVAK